MIDCGAFDSVAVMPTESQNRVSKGDLFFNGSSETAEEVGMCAVLMQEVHNVFLNSFCFGFRFFAGAPADGLYLAYFFRSSEGRELLKSLAQGATRYNLSKTALLKIAFPSPQLSEQTAIATFLSDIDAEIAALEAKLAKATPRQAGHDAGAADWENQAPGRGQAVSRRYRANGARPRSPDGALAESGAGTRAAKNQSVAAGTWIALRSIQATSARSLAMKNPTGITPSLTDSLSEHEIVRKVADQAARRITRKVIAALQRMHHTLSGDDAELKTTWDEICVQSGTERVLFLGRLRRDRPRLSFRLRGHLARHEREAISLETECRIRLAIR